VGKVGCEWYQPTTLQERHVGSSSYRSAEVIENNGKRWACRSNEGMFLCSRQSTAGAAPTQQVTIIPLTACLPLLLPAARATDPLDPAPH
jgi:hypothetical protein